jgi:23S rRNA (pseudouridine1915-N3)-methyltransferase
MKAGPERELFDRYVSRAKKLGPSLGYNGPVTREIPESRDNAAAQRKAAEAASLTTMLNGRNARLIVFDERGKSPSSVDFSDCLSRWRDDGIGETVLAIGGPDGFDDTVRERAAMVVSFGRLTMPHQIVRILVAEQIYRAMTIAANHPYHRQ